MPTDTTAYRTKHPLPGEQRPPAAAPYSLGKLIADLADPFNTRPGRRASGRALEVHDELAERYRIETDGTLLPMDIWGDPERRALTTSNTSAAVGSYLSGNIIPALRPLMGLSRLGATITQFSPPHGGDLKIARVSSGSAVHWVAEGSAPDETAMTTDSITFSPKCIAGRTSVTRSMLMLAGTAEFERRVRDDILLALANAIDLAGIVGAGEGEDAQGVEPLGLLENPDVPVVPLGTNGAALTRLNLVTMEKTVALANADVDPTAPVGWLTTPATRAKLRMTEQSTGSGRWTWKDDDTILGRRAVASTNVPADLVKGSGAGLSALICGAFSYAHLNLFGPPDIIVDPFSSGPSGTVWITVRIHADWQLARPSAFVAATDVVTSLS